MSETQSAMSEEKELRPEEKRMLRRQDNAYFVKIGVTLFVTVVCCILFFFLLYRFSGFADIWNKLFTAASPIIIGLILAYLVNPVKKAVEKPLRKKLIQKMKSEAKAKKLARGISVFAATLFLLVVITLLIVAIVPAVVSSVAGLVATLPNDVANFVTKVQEGELGDSEIATYATTILTKVVDQIEEWAQKDLLPQAQTYITQITTGVISAVKAVLNFIIGIIVAVYVMMIEDTLIGQSKKILFAVAKPATGNRIIEVVHKANEIFSGFISGKILDSAIIGLICYIGCCIMHIPDAILVAVIVGITNIIPVFGPFIGAIPSLLLVVIQSPWHALYLLIFIIVLQQVDGNIIGPKILGESTGLSSFWVMFAILIFGGLFGFAGMLLGVPTFAVIYYLIRRAVNHRVRKKQLPEPTVAYIKAQGIDEQTHSLVYPKENEEKEETLPPEEKNNS